MLTVRLERLMLRQGSMVLDLGAGGGRHSYAACARGCNAVAVDLRREDLIGARRGFAEYKEMVGLDGSLELDVVQGDARSLPLGDCTFDAVICSEVLEHIVEDTWVVDEIVRVLKPGGHVALTVPRWGPEVVNWLLSREYHSADGGHIRIFTRRRVLASMLGTKSSAVRLQGSHHAHALHSPYWWVRSWMGIENDQAWIVRALTKVVVYEMMHPGGWWTKIERVLNPLFGKSLVVYGVKV
jgi:SAM-dependent methyltransferase